MQTVILEPTFSKHLVCAFKTSGINNTSLLDCFFHLPFYHEYFVIQYSFKKYETSLAVQWLRLRALNAGSQVQFLVGALRSRVSTSADKKTKINKLNK